jgi:threonine synthase
VLKATQGGCIRVSDDEVRSAIAQLGACSGVFAEPAGAAALAGLHKALELKLVDRRERVALLITGNGLKDPAAAGSFLPEARRVAPRLEALPRTL